MTEAGGLMRNTLRVQSPGASFLARHKPTCN